MSDLAAAATALNTLIGQYGLTRDQIVDLMSGVADGGPNGDGLYPVTLDNGTVVYIPSPQLIRQSALAAVSAAAMGIEAVADTAARDAFFAEPGNQNKLVYVNNNNGAADDPANGIYEYADGAPRLATAFLQSFAAIFQALADAAKAWAESDQPPDPDYPDSKSAKTIATELYTIYSVLGGFEEGGAGWGVRNQAPSLPFGAWLLSIDALTNLFSIDTPTRASQPFTLMAADVRGASYNGSRSITYADASAYSSADRLLSVGNADGDEIIGIGAGGEIRGLLKD